MKADLRVNEYLARLRAFDIPLPDKREKDPNPTFYSETCSWFMPGGRIHINFFLHAFDNGTPFFILQHAIGNQEEMIFKTPLSVDFFPYWELLKIFDQIKVKRGKNEIP